MKDSIYIGMLLFMLCSTLGNAQSKRIHIKSDQMKEVNYLQMDDFYLTHYLYIDLFLREGLLPDASLEEVASILTAIKKYVAVETPLRIEIDTPGGKRYKISVVVLKKGGDELLIAFTNWSVKKKKFEEDIQMENDSYTRWYFLNADKMTYRKDLSKENDYDTTDTVDLANTYLFDEIGENDGEVPTILEAVLKGSELRLDDQITADLILLKYYVLKGKEEKTAAQVTTLTEVFETDPAAAELLGLKSAFDVSKFQIDLMNGSEE
ncbi:hypothetical protein [Lutimonas sp.]|uniref:hypothetical protein n=1 Tax=Lutimonas sp. TaxID=1872403 RepID=UPI003D9ACF9B